MSKVSRGSRGKAKHHRVGCRAFSLELFSDYLHVSIVIDERIEDESKC